MSNVMQCTLRMYKLNVCTMLSQTNYFFILKIAQWIFEIQILFQLFHSDKTKT